MEQQHFSVSEEGLFRHQVVSEVEARVRAGMTVSAAIGGVVAVDRQDLKGRSRRLSERTVYRWLEAFRSRGVRGLEPAPRQRVATSEALSRGMLQYLRAQKLLDPAASVPEVIRRAEAHGVVARGEVSRTSVWRACLRMGLPVSRPRRLEERDMRRFSYPHRMMMVLADGKHFRAGADRRRRVALPLLDDATRKGLAVVVATSECTELFLTALYQAILRFGLMTSLFLDNGPGFVSSDTRTVVAALGIQLIHGSRGYPQGHGKVERFHRRLNDQVLRGLDGNPSVDPDPASLTLRLSHWLAEVYNHDPHRGLDGASPLERWESDERALVYPEEGWRRHFVITADRKVSHDNVISYDGSAYEMPRGHAGETVPVSRHLLDGNALTVVHEGKAVKLARLDPTANARSRRGRPARPGNATAQTPPTTAADARFGSDFEPLVDADGGYRRGDDDDDE
jgi:transposase InsO family protein